MPEKIPNFVSRSKVSHYRAEVDLAKNDDEHNYKIVRRYYHRAERRQAKRDIKAALVLG
jgi:hypothetical protein